MKLLWINKMKKKMLCMFIYVMVVGKCDMHTSNVRN